MKCIKLKNTKDLQIATIKKPVSKDGSVIIRVKACGICGSDLHYFEAGEPKELILGHEFSGIVVDPGDRVDLKIGDRVTGLPISPCGICEPCKTGNIHYCANTWTDAVGLSLTNSGGLAEFLSCRSDMVKKLPDKVSFLEGTMVEPSAVSLHAINLANIKVGDKVLIIGGGIIGLMVAEFAKLNGASYVALMETNMKRGKKAMKYGKVNEVLNATNPDVIEKSIKKTNGGFDKVIECCGNKYAVSEAIMTVKPGGTIVLVGVSLTEISIPMVASVMKEVNMQGAIAYNEHEFETVIRLIEKKIIDVSKYIDSKISLEKVQDAYLELISGTTDKIKIVVKP